MQHSAVIFIDFINDLLADEGAMADRGYTAFAKKHGSIENAAKILAFARSMKLPVFFVNLGFYGGDYLDVPGTSPLFAGVKARKAFPMGYWGTEVVNTLTIEESDFLMNKPRVSAFEGTPLEATLSALQINHLILLGCSTDLAVNNTARAAHDKDFLVTVVEDACVAASDEDHNNTITLLKKIAQISTAGLITSSTK